MKAVDDPAHALHRSGAVARMLQMPVATLRVWERRYALTGTALSVGGQRLYSDADVRRLALLRQLTERGHAIGSLAPLDMAQLQRVAATRAQALAATQAGRRAAAVPVPSPRALRLVVVGAALGARLQQPALLQPWGRPVELLGPFDSVAQAVAALAADRPGRAADAWLVHEPQLHAGWKAAFDAALSPRTRTRSRAGRPPQAPAAVAVLFSYAAAAVCEALAAAGVSLLREPQPDAALAQWLRLWSDAAAAPVSAVVDGAATAAAARRAVPPRRWDDTALADFAVRPTTVACECPRHVAELLVQLSRFEAYSAQCRQRSPADAELHAFLERVAADARSGFEGALERMALLEGLPLPASASSTG